MSFDLDLYREGYRAGAAAAWEVGYSDGFGDGGVNAWEPRNPYREAQPSGRWVEPIPPSSLAANPEYQRLREEAMREAEESPDYFIARNRLAIFVEMQTPWRA